MGRLHRRTRQRGVSLIEALIAMAIMGFGMLAIVGVQSTLRFNADMSKQRAEATRMAEQELERVRAFSRVASGINSDIEFDGILNRTVVLTQTELNADFTLVRTVTNAPDGHSKTIAVVISWVDRIGETRQVAMNDVIARVDPVLAGMVKAERPLTAVGRRDSRHPTIPGRAKDLGNGSSIFKPTESGSVGWVFNNATGAITHTCTGVSGATASLSTATVSSSCTLLSISAQLVSGVIRFNLRGATQDLGSISALKPAATGDVAWVIDNGTSSVVSICPVPAATPTTSLTLADLAAGCTATAMPISPFQKTDIGYTLVAADSENPRWPTLPANVEIDLSIPFHEGFDTARSICYSDRPALDSSLAIAVTSPPQYLIPYFCIVQPTSTTGWGARLRVTPLPFSNGNQATWEIGSTAGKYKVCRYTSATTDFTDNIDHPAIYSRDSASCTSACQPVQGNLVNQNYLVIDGTKSCPTDVAADPANGNMVNSNTLLHQY